MPSPAEIAKAEMVNARTGKGQPQGSFDMEKFTTQGWFGADLNFYKIALEKPRTADELAVQYLCTRIHSEPGLRAAMAAEA